MERVKHLIAQSVGFLEQGVELVEHLDDRLYRARGPGFRHGNVGAHLRHCIDYYTCLLGGLPRGHVDYDARPRDERTEVDRGHALGRLRAVIAALAELAGTAGRGEHPLTVTQDAPASEASPLRSRSSLARELQFAMSHTVHHYALIRVILHLHGHAVDDEFGVAPSTLRYWLESAAAGETSA